MRGTLPGVFVIVLLAGCADPEPLPADWNSGRELNAGVISNGEYAGVFLEGMEGPVPAICHAYRTDRALADSCTITAGNESTFTRSTDTGTETRVYRTPKPVDWVVVASWPPIDGDAEFVARVVVFDDGGRPIAWWEGSLKCTKSRCFLDG